MTLGHAISIVDRMDLNNLRHGNARNPLTRNEIVAIERLLAVGVAFNNFAEVIGEIISE